MKIQSVFLIIIAALSLGLAILRTASISRYNERMRRRKKSRKRRHASRPAPRLRLDLLTRTLYALAAAALAAAFLFAVGDPDPQPQQTEPGQVTTAPTEPAQPTAAPEPDDPTGTDDPAEPTDDGGDRFALGPDGFPVAGWQELNGDRYYFDSTGIMQTGWMDLDGKRYYFDETGILHTGWMELDGKRYYFDETGAMGRGRVEINGSAHYFTADGDYVVLVNFENPVPDGYTHDLVALSTDYGVEGSRVDRSCHEALMNMIDACNAEAARAFVVSSYRSVEYQTTSYNKKVNSYIDQGYTREEAEKEAATIVARPGTSEHHLGLAVDIIDNSYWVLDEAQAELPAQQWLMENSWRYGFILRYPPDKMAFTGIIFEPWHYRYVGEELARELYESGLTLEEYMANIS